MKPRQRRSIRQFAQKPAAERGYEHNTHEGKLLNVLEVLNWVKDTERGKPFMRLFARWRAAKSLAEMIGADPQLGNDLARATEPVVFKANKNGKGGKFIVTPSASFDDAQYVVDRGDEPDSLAIWLFANLVTNPLANEDFAGPCERCGDYYFRKRVDQKKYCSKNCGRTATAKVSNISIAKAEREGKMERARTLIQKWESIEHPGVDWKTWVARRDKTLKKSWLTRATNPRTGYGLQAPSPLHE